MDSLKEKNLAEVLQLYEEQVDHEVLDGLREFGCKVEEKFNNKFENANLQEIFSTDVLAETFELWYLADFEVGEAALKLLSMASEEPGNN